jgi:hypothetical protein
MSDYVKVLEQAREQMVKARRSLAEGLARPYDGRTTPGLRSGLIEVQTVIEQIDKAIVDERRAAPAAPIKDFDKDDPYGELNEGR